MSYTPHSNVPSLNTAIWLANDLETELMMLSSVIKNADGTFDVELGYWDPDDENWVYSTIRPGYIPEGGL